MSIDKEWFIHIDWDKFLELAMHHRIYSIIYPKMKEIDEKLIPAYVMQNYINNIKEIHFKCFI